MTVAVTGARGFVGRRLVPMLADAGASVRVLTRAEGGARFAGDVRVCDLADERALRTALAGVDAVVHLAAVAHTTLRNAAELAAARAVNVAGTHALARAARAAGVRHLLFFSSAHVYAGQQGVALAEGGTKDAGAGYGGMKAEAEDLLAKEWPAGQVLTIVRPCLTYGPGARFNLLHLMHAIQSRRYVHPGGGDVLRSFASVDTVCRATVHLLTRRCAGVFNVADREPQRLRAWVDGLARDLGAPTPWTVPLPVLRGVAAVGTLARKRGLPAPLTSETLQKLTVPFTLDVSRLAATGFVWPCTDAAVRCEMAEAFLAGKEERTA